MKFNIKALKEILEDVDDDYILVLKDNNLHRHIPISVYKDDTLKYIAIDFKKYEP